MKRFRLTVAVGLVAAAAISTVVWAAGMYSNFPVVGGAAFCSANNLAGIPGTSSVCTPGGTSHQRSGWTVRSERIGTCSRWTAALTIIHDPMCSPSARSMRFPTVLRLGNAGRYLCRVPKAGRRDLRCYRHHHCHDGDSAGIADRWAALLDYIYPDDHDLDHPAGALKHRHHGNPGQSAADGSHAVNDRGLWL